MTDISRREFFRSISPVHKKRRGDEEVTFGEHAVEAVGEIATVLVMLHLALESSADKRLYVVRPEPAVPVSSDPAELEARLGEIFPAMKGLNELANTVRSFEDLWHSLYRKSRTVKETECTGTGEDKKCETTEKTVYYWDEPNIGINHNTIDVWKGFLENLNNHFQHLYNGQPSTGMLPWGVESFQFPLYEVEQSGRNNFILGGVLVSGALYAFYEEFLSVLGSNSNDLSFLDQIDKKRITRRSFAKVLVGVVAGTQIKSAEAQFAEANSHVQSDAINYAGNVIDQGNLGADDSFYRFFGTSVNAIVQQLDGVIVSCQNVIDGGRFWEGFGSIVAALTTIQQQAAEYEVNFWNAVDYRARSEHHIPEKMVTAMNELWVTDQIKGYANRRNVEINTSVIAEVLSVAGILLGSGVAIELVLAAMDAGFQRVQEVV